MTPTTDSMCDCDETIGFDRTGAVTRAVCRKCGHSWPLPASRKDFVPRILVDCDGVLADFIGAVLEYATRSAGVNLQREAIDRWDCFAAVGMSDHWPYFRVWCDDLDGCRNMAVLDGAADLWAEVNRLDPTAKVCTTPMSIPWLSQRAAWLHAFGVPLNRTWQGEGKEALAGGAAGYNVLIDDKPENCEAFVDAGGRAFCIAAAYNAHVRADVPRGSHSECIAWLRTQAGVQP